MMLPPPPTYTHTNVIDTSDMEPETVCNELEAKHLVSLPGSHDFVLLLGNFSSFPEMGALQQVAELCVLGSPDPISKHRICCPGSRRINRCFKVEKNITME